MKHFLLLVILVTLAYSQATVNQIKFTSASNVRIAVTGDTTYSQVTMLKFPPPFTITKESTGVYRVDLPLSPALDCTQDPDHNISCRGSLSAASLGAMDTTHQAELELHGVSLMAPPTITSSYRLQLPSTPPAPGQQLTFDAPDPTTHIAVGKWK